MRPHIHINLTTSEQAYVAIWRRRVLAGCAIAAIALLASAQFQHLFEQNTGSLARISPPAVAENVSAAAPR